MDDESFQERFNSFVDSDSEELSKDSLDYKNLKIKVYEETVNDLLEENKTLKQQVKRMQDEIKELEEKFIQAINEATEDRKKLDEKSQSKYRAQLQSYYECFLQLEKENDVLKVHVQQLCEKLQKYEDKSVDDKSTPITDPTDDSMKTSNELLKNRHSNYDNRDLNSSICKSISQNVLNEKDEEIKELKYEIEQLKSENDTFKSMKNYIEEQNEKRASSIALSKLNVNQHQEIEELHENINHLEMEKSLLTKKLSSMEASLTRWIFRACDYKTDLQQTRHECEELRKDNNYLNDDKQKLTARLNEIEKNCRELEEKCETERMQQAKIKFQFNSLETDLEQSKQIIKQLNDKIEKLNLELKNVNAKSEALLSENEKHLNEKINNLNKQIQSLNALNMKLESDRKLMEKDNDGLKRNLNDIQRKNKIYEDENYELKNKITKIDVDVSSLKELKASNEQLKSEVQYFNKKIESLLNENSSIKKKFDANLLEKNSIKCKYEEIIREINDLKAKNKQLNEINETLSLNIHQHQQMLQQKKRHEQAVATQTTPITITENISVQTDDFNYEGLFKSIKDEYEQKLNDFIYKEQVYRNEIEQLKHRLNKHDNQFIMLNRNLEDEYKINMDIRERNDFLFEKCEKLKHDLDDHENKFLKFKLNHEIEKEVLETTISQQKKFIDYIITTQPELGKKFKLFSSKK